MDSDQIDIAAKRLQTVAITHENMAEQRARLERERLELMQRLHIQRATFYVLGPLYVLLIITATATILLHPIEETRRWAVALLGSLVSGLGGYFIGHKQK